MAETPNIALSPTPYIATPVVALAPLASTSSTTNAGIVATNAYRWVRPRQCGRNGLPSGEANSSLLRSIAVCIPIRVSMFAASWRSRGRQIGTETERLATVSTEHLSTEHFDVLIVGAGISGISAAYHLQTMCPNRTYEIVEGRADLGGTWDLFRYPGVRSDSDMHTLGYSFKPWTQAKAIADGPAILQYLRDTCREFGIDRHIRFHHRVINAEWSSERGQWTVTTHRTMGSKPSSPPRSCSCARAITAIAVDTPRISPEWNPLGGPLSIRSNGRKIWTTRANEWS